MLINPTRNGRQIQPPSGHKRDGGSLAVVLDLFSRMVGGWSMAALQDAPFVVNALEMALARRRPQAELLPHSYRGNSSKHEPYLALFQPPAMTLTMSGTAN